MFRVKGFPLANISWHLNGQPLEWSDRNYREYQLDHRAQIEGGLEILKKTQASNGLYTLVAENGHGVVEKSVSITFKSPFDNSGKQDRVST